MILGRSLLRDRKGDGKRGPSGGAFYGDMAFVILQDPLAYDQSEAVPALLGGEVRLEYLRQKLRSYPRTGIGYLISTSLSLLA